MARDSTKAEDSSLQEGLSTKPQLTLPGLNRPESEFADEVGELVGPLEILFRFNGSVVEVAEEEFDDELDRFKLARGGLKFSSLSPIRAKTWLEQFVETGLWLPKEDRSEEKENKPVEFVFKAKTMSEVVARSLLVSPQFLRRIPRVVRILDVPIPIRPANGEIIFPKPGFNRELGVYCATDAPIPKALSLDEAREILEEAHAGFCWKNPQSKVHALARLVTPYARGLMGFSERPPLWYFGGNRPRCGKDYCNGVSQITYIGHTFEDFAITDDPQETEKRIVSALRAGRRMMHFANCQGYLEDAGFIQAITAPTIGARALGSNDAKSDLELPNEIDYSISANALTYREDVEPRLRKIELCFFEEDANARIFPKPFLHNWINENRVRVLSAIHSLVLHWMRAGAPAGKSLFNSFPGWAEVVGGIMSSSGLGDPALPHEREDLLGGDYKERAMRALFEIAYDAFPEEWLKKSDLYDLIREKRDEVDYLTWFGDLDGEPKEKAFATKRIGNALANFQNRILGGVRLLIDTSTVKGQQWRYRFTKDL